MSPDRPRFRRDLEATPTEADGQSFVDVRDPKTGGTFRFYEFEYRVAMAFDGLPYDRVIPWLRLVAGLDYQEGQLREFATYLHDMGVLESSPRGIQVTEEEAVEEPIESNEWEAERRATTVDEPPALVSQVREEVVAVPTEPLEEADLEPIEPPEELAAPEPAPPEEAPAPAEELAAPAPAQAEEAPPEPAPAEELAAPAPTPSEESVAPAPTPPEEVPTAPMEVAPPEPSPAADDASAAPVAREDVAPAAIEPREEIAPSPDMSLEDAPTVPVPVEFALNEMITGAGPVLSEAGEGREPSLEAPAEAAPLAGSGGSEESPPEAAAEPEATDERVEMAAVPDTVGGQREVPAEEAAPSPADFVQEAVVVGEAAPSPADVVHEAVVTPGVEIVSRPTEMAAEAAELQPREAAEVGVAPSEQAPEEASPGAAETQDGYAPAASADLTPAGRAIEEPASAETLDGFAPVVEAAPAPTSPDPASSFTEIILDGVTPPVEEVPSPSLLPRKPAGSETVPIVAESVAEGGTGAAKPSVQITAPYGWRPEAAAPTSVQSKADVGAETVVASTAAATPAAEAAAPAIEESGAASAAPVEGAALAREESAEPVVAPTEAVGASASSVAPSAPETISPAEPSEEAGAPAGEAPARDASEASPELRSSSGSRPARSILPTPAAPTPPFQLKPEPQLPTEARTLDSLAFPVLPTPPPEAVGHFPPRRSSSATWPVQASLHTPPPVTPPPVTLGPQRAAQQAAERKHQRRSLLLFGSLGVLAAVALLAVLVPLFFPAHSTPRAEVRTAAAAPGTVLRYFAGNGAITMMPGVVLKFPASGVVVRIAKANSLVAVGDVVAAVEAARPLLTQLTHLRERLAFYRQIADAMHQVGNTAEEEKNTANVEVRKAKIAKTLRALAQVAVVASSAGQVEEAFAREGDHVEAGGLALRMRSAGYRAIFELPRAQAAQARRLAFCQVGVEGYVLDCRQASDDDDETHVSVHLTSLPTALLGRPAHLARARFDNAVVLPASAVQRVGRRFQVLVVSPFGRLEARLVTVAEQSVAEVVVIQGLDSGENVVIEPASDLRPGMQVAIRH